ncbi:MAG: DUF4405 domain-containing protein [Chlamydiota bacterium]
MKVKFWLDMILFVAFLLTAVTGVSISISAAHHWVILHKFFAVTTVILVVIHISLHWDWISFARKKIFGPKGL